MIPSSSSHSPSNPPRRRRRRRCFSRSLLIVTPRLIGRWRRHAQRRRSRAHGTLVRRRCLFTRRRPRLSLSWLPRCRTIIVKRPRPNTHTGRRTRGRRARARALPRRSPALLSDDIIRICLPPGLGLLLALPSRRAGALPPPLCRRGTLVAVPSPPVLEAGDPAFPLLLVHHQEAHPFARAEFLWFDGAHAELAGGEVAAGVGEGFVVDGFDLEGAEAAGPDGGRVVDAGLLAARRHGCGWWSARGCQDGVTLSSCFSCPLCFLRRSSPGHPFRPL